MACTKLKARAQEMLDIIITFVRIVSEEGFARVMPVCLTGNV